MPGTNVRNINCKISFLYSFITAFVGLQRQLALELLSVRTVYVFYATSKIQKHTVRLMLKLEFQTSFLT